MALYKHTDGKLLYIGGALAHDANCCCSVCSNDVTVECCLRGESFPTGQCDCDLLGGYATAEANPCNGSTTCSDTIVSCCYEGNSLSLSDCDCAIIGGISNPETCTPLTGECSACMAIEIASRVIPHYWPCLTNNGTCASSPNICAPPAWDPTYQMCFGYEGCDQIGNCITCDVGGAYCHLSGTYSMYEYSHYETAGPCGTDEILHIANPSYFCTELCCQDPYVNIPIIRTIIYQTVNRCGTYTLKRTNGSAYKYEGSGCSQIDTNIVNYSDTSISYNCGIPC